MSDVLRDITRQIISDPVFAASLRASDDTGLLARGLPPVELPLVRELLSPLQNFSWLLPGQLAACARPRTAESVKMLAEDGVRVLISLTEDPLPSAWLRDAGIKAIHIPIPDFHAPTQDQLQRITSIIDRCIEGHEPVAIHCAAGRGRTGTALTAYFIHRGLTVDDALAEVRRLRPSSVETADQFDALLAYARNGAPG